MCLSAVSIFLFLAPCFAQTKTLIKRTNYKTETVEFGVGGTVSIIGAPQGSIKVEGWNKNEVEISAEVEMQAENEADLAELAKVNGFAIDEDFGHLRITSVGTHDKDYMKRVAKKFPKNLLGLPFKIDYVIKVPVYSDVEIDGGTGDLEFIERRRLDEDKLSRIERQTEFDRRNSRRHYRQRRCHGRRSKPQLARAQR